MWGRGRRGNSAALLSASFQSLPLLPTSKLGPSGADSCLGGWVCVCFRTLWVSPTNSSVRLGVSPTTSTPTGVLNQRFEALFPQTGTLGFEVYLTLLLFLSVYLHTNMGLPSPPALVLQLLPCHKSSPPSCPSPPLFLVWMNVSSLTTWLSDFHTVRFSVSSGCFMF